MKITYVSHYFVNTQNIRDNWANQDITGHWRRKATKSGGAD